MREVVDRIENNLAVLVSDAGKSRQVALSKLPQEVKEGDVLVNGKIDRQQTKATKTRVSKLIKDIFKKR